MARGPDLPWGVFVLLAAGARGKEEVDHRRRLYQAVTRYPGLHLAGLAREADVDEPLARYHIRVLVRRGLATEVEEAGFLRYYPKVEGELGTRETVDRADKALLAILRRPVPLRMVLELLDAEDGVPMAALAEAAGVTPQTATYHVGNLVKAGVVETVREGRSRRARLVDTDRVVGLLVRYPPPKDVVEGFIEVWDQLDL